MSKMSLNHVAEGQSRPGGRTAGHRQHPPPPAGHRAGGRHERVLSQKSPAGDPVAYLIRGAVIAIRSEDSSQIVVEGLLN